jgi:hypothetical protein
MRLQDAATAVESLIGGRESITSFVLSTRDPRSVTLIAELGGDEGRNLL